MLKSRPKGRQQIIPGSRDSLSHKKVSSRKRLGYTVAPLLILLLIFGLTNFFSPEEQQEQMATIGETAVSSTQNPPAATATRRPILQATILPSPTPAATPRLELPITTDIIPIGPPANSSLPRNSRIAFYWTFSGSLQPGQEFVLTMQQNDEEIALGTATRPNLGDGYQLLVDLTTVDVLPGTAVWQLHLEWSENHQRLLSSEERTITFLPE